MKFFPILLMGLALVGCKTTYTRHPVGSQAEDIEAQRKNWEGVWKGAAQDEPTVRIKVADGQKGILSVTWSEKKKNPQNPKAQQRKQFTAQAYLRSHESWTFVSMNPTPPDEKEAWGKDLLIWGRIKMKDNQIAIWTPDEERIRALITEGKLPGSVHGNDDVVLDDLSPANLDRLTTDTDGLLFDWESPLVLFKQPGNSK